MFNNRYIYEVESIVAEVVDTFTIQRIYTYNSNGKIHI